MKSINQYFFTALTIAAMAVAIFLALGVATPGISAATGTPTPPPGQVIPIQPIADLTSLDATVKIEMNGLINDQATQGDLTMLLTTNDRQESKITLSGSLLGQIAAQIGGSLLGLLTPKELEIYNIPAGTYVVLKSFFPICLKPETTPTTASPDELSPQQLMSMLTGPEVARGQFVGEETLNGVAVKHYVINGAAFLAAAKQSDNPKLRNFSHSLWSAKDADLYIDATSGYPVAFNGSYNGVYKPLDFQGDFGVRLELTGLNTNTPVELPSACDNPISQ